MACNRTTRIRSANSRLACWLSSSTSRPSWPKPLTTRTPVTAASTCPTSSPDCCWAAQLAGNRSRREARATSHSAGAMASAIRVSSGDSQSIATIEMTNSSALPVSAGMKASRPCTRLTSLIERLTTCPVSSASCAAPSSRCRAVKMSPRRSYCTSSESRPAV